MNGPYGEAAWAYWAAGWRGVVPLPVARKGPPPSGYTGWAGITPSGADVQAWCDGPQAAGNIGLRLPRGVYGLDVDAYGSKSGGAALEALQAALGPLPATWCVTSRTDGVSGIRVFRAELPEGRRWRDEPAGHGAGIEAIHFGHRYAVVWPSKHPEGGTYIWADHTDGRPVAVPSPERLPELPAAWVEALSEPGEIASGEAAGHGDTVAAVQAMREGDACDRVGEASARALDRLRQASDGAALHPAARDGTHELVRLGHEGHIGARRALAEHFSAFVDVRTKRGEAQRAAEGEWWRLVRGAVGKLTGPRLTECLCVLPDVGFEWSPVATAVGAVADEPTEDGGEGGVGGSDPEVEAFLAELLTPSQLEALPNPVPLISGLLDMNTLTWLIGKSGSFKSFVALDLAGHVAAGREWAHRPVRRGLVVYLVAEGGGGMKLRKRAWEAQNGPMDEHMILFMVRPVQARGPEWSILVRAVAHLRPVLIVTDTQARVSVGIKENDNTEMGQLIEQFDRLRRASGACVLTVHHIGRSGEDARGASAIDGAQDTELRVERVGGSKAMTARLTVDKQKDGADTGAVDFEMVRVEGGTDPETGRDLSSLALKITSDLFSGPLERPWRENLPENQSMILDILHEQFSERGGTRAEVAAVLRERGRTGERRFVKSSFHTAWNELLKKDRIEQVPGTQRFMIFQSET